MTVRTRDLDGTQARIQRNPVAEEMMQKVNGIELKLSKVVSIQHYFRAREARHRI